MNIDLIKIVYLFFRLAPIIIVSYFTLSSIFNNDLRGIIYLAGLLLTCMIVHSVWRIFGPNEDTTQSLGNCGLTFIGMNENPFSNVPLGLTTLAYTLSYVGTFIIKQKLQKLNIPTLIILPSLVVFEAVFLLNQNCNSTESIALALAGCIILGMCWALFIYKYKIVELQVFTGVNSAQVCSRPTKKDYVCKKVPNQIT